MAALQPVERMQKLQNEGKFTEKMMVMEAAKTMPFGDIWEKYCELQGVPACDEEWFATVMKYEEEVQLKRA